MMRRKRDRRYWRNLGLAALFISIDGICVIGVVLVILVINSMDRILYPPRMTITQTPEDYGIADYRDVTFTASDGITLRGWYIPSENGAAIILAHGHANNRQPLLPEAAFLAEQGYGVLLFDFRGHGESDRAAVTLGDHERRDLRAALDFVAAQPDVDPNRIGGLGFSMGAATLAQVAAEDDRFRAVVIEGSYASLDEVIKDRIHLPGALRDPLMQIVEMRQDGDIDDARPVDDLCDISPRPALLIYGDQDDVLPPGTQKKMFAAVCAGTETWLLPGVGHVFFKEHQTPEYEARIVAFFEQGLAG
jgi:dipeptidyl aminopeptidase/acylaminoacyl peptidase